MSVFAFSSHEVFSRNERNKARPETDPRRAKSLVLLKWAWVELNYRPHAYQAASNEHELGSEVPTSLPFTNIPLSIPCI